MFWSLSLQLMPDETITERSDTRPDSVLKASYSVVLTTKRAVFRFRSLGSGMAQSFIYREIESAEVRKRLMINYLLITTPLRQHYIHTPEPEFWAAKILECKKNDASSVSAASATPAVPGRKKRELLNMLAALRKHEVLTAAEFESKKKLLETQSIPE